MGNVVLEYAAVFAFAFVLLEIVTFGWYMATSRIARSGYSDRFAVAVSRINGGYSVQFFLTWQALAFAAYHATTVSV